jgi:hypothetical protein
MPSVTTFRDTESAGQFPSRGTLPASANTLYPKGCIVTRSAAGRAVNPTTADLTGLPAIGVCQATVDNRTNAEAGGLDDSVDIDVEYGVFGFNIAAGSATPVPGDLMYVFDNNSVTTVIGVTRGVAGKCCEVRVNSKGVLQAYVYISPIVAPTDV